MSFFQRSNAIGWKALLAGFFFLLPLWTGAQTQPYPGAPNDLQYRFVDAGGHHSVALRCDGTVRTWGANGEGQLGNNSLIDSDVPVAVVNALGDTMTGFVAVDAGTRHTLALQSDGTVWAWGRGNEGQLGDNNFATSIVPVQVNNIDSAVAIAAGDDFSLALLHDSTVVGWGQNGQGQLGNAGLGASVGEPTLPFDGIADAVSIAAGNCHSMLIRDSLRTVWTVGCDDAGQLGDDGNSSDVTAPVIVNHFSTGNPITQIVGIAGGVEHSIAVDRSGEVYTWGATSGGGNNVELARSCATPDCKMAGEANDGISDAVAVAAGWKSSTVMREDSTLISWGENDDGELGLGFNSATQTPTAVTTLSEKVVAISSGIADGSGGGQHSVAMLADDSLRTWGLNDAGQLGNGSTGGSENNPQEVIDMSIDIVQAFAGNDTVVCSGDSAQLGRSMPPEDTSEYDYSWSPTTGLSNPSIPNPKAAINTSSSQTITYVLWKTYKTDSTPSACVRPDSVTVTFNSGVEADFAANDPKCVGEEVDIANTGSNGPGYEYQWDLGSGASPSSSTASSPPPVSYASSGLKQVKLTVFDSVCNDTVSQVKGVDIKEEPTPGFVSSAPQCREGKVDFTNTGSSGAQWNYSWDFGSGASPNSSTAEDPSGVTYSTSGTKTITQTITDDNGFCSATQTGVIDILDRPVASFTSTAPACTADSLDFNNTGSSGGGYSYSWDFGAGATPSSSTAENPSGVTYSSSGNKSVRFVIENTGSGCSDTAELSITVHQSPATGFTSTAPACEGMNVDFTNTGSSGSQWDHTWDFGAGASPSSSNAEDPSGIQYSSSGSKTVTQTISGNNCTAKDTQSITILARPEASLAHDGPSCTDDTVQFDNTGSSGAPYTFSWDFGAGAAPSSSTQESEKVVYSSAGNKQLELVIQNTNTGCADTAWGSLSVHQTPTTGFTSTAPVCEEAPVDFTNTGSSGGQWNYSWDFGPGSSPSISSAEDPGGVSYSTNGTKTVTQTISGANGLCSATDTQNIQVEATPDASFSSTAPQCTGEPIDFSNTGSSGGSYSYEWDLGVDANPATSTDENPSAVTYSSSGNKQAMQVIENTTTGCRDTAWESFTIHLSPTVSFSSTAPECAGDAVDFTNTGSSGQQWSYDWDLGSGSSPSNSTSEHPSGVSYQEGGTRTVTLTLSSAHCQRTDSMSITIDSLPEADAGPDTTICADRSVQIGTPGEPGNTYLWSPGSTLDDPTAAQPVASPVAEFTSYQLQVEDNVSGCRARDSVTVTMLGSGLVEAGEDAEICRGDSVQLGVGLIEGQDYQWLPEGGLSDPNSPHPVASPDSTTIYRVGVSRYGCDTLWDEVEIVVRPLPDANAGKDLDVLRGESVRLMASGGVSYEWSPEEGLDEPLVSSPHASPETNTLYRVLVTDLYGCQGRDSVWVRVLDPEYFVPSAFTPDGDGRNDRFLLRGPRLDEFQMEIFDRSGERIFMSEDPSRGWDGRIRPAGERAPQGAYPYRITGVDKDGNDRSFQGMINLIR